ncbi:RNA polymerase-like protein II mediator complex component Srb8 [Mollisia scopiformis]|uniref:Mediator of RNA polymerase II transcription subunit 12 n=1 Tax=Mollisia scopiformis TaxID=149040 RepID=A0A132B4P7_MOLSC|nr:RNA polymerase-like protein II mediator complex component Srb8 [Mollisia scopiformis]KUJ07380.1 RNA polymeras-like protein II mediator complex component Srb8 [Mollisia scopiformis]
MTSRIVGPPGREPLQRSFSSSTTTFSRPSPHRTLSQKFPSSSPTRRTNDVLIDLTVDADAAGRHAPRIGTSRLRLEVSTDSKSALVESPAPTSDSTSTWKPSLPIPPRGRPVLHFDVPSVSNLSPRPSQDGGQDESTIKPMPLPVRPRQHAPPALGKSRHPAGASVKKDVRPKPYVLEVPTIAPHYPPNGHADFFPWTGNHTEDQFSEHVIRHGYLDKAQMTQNETASARSSIFPALKHKSGLQTLSSLLTNVLAQRRAHGQITSASTFKPPPRVTVTDTKREMWLKDLANPTISLRRLSRSIPHGIRGKVLLDQSLSKNIPIERAVWLAKCVGANELRSFRRKGASGTFAMGGEAKWIRDFTVCVEQFIESIAGTCGEKDFRVRIDYAIRLATHFHAEHLLDRDHYMDWLVSSVENSPQAKLPMWLLITEIYWKDILQYRKYGRRLATALMNQLTETLNHPDHDILAPLSDRLVVLLDGMMVSNPESFIAPKSWLKYRDALMSSLSGKSNSLSTVLLEIDRRNNRLAASSAKKELNSRRRFIKLLDRTLSHPFSHELARQWWQTDEDKDMLMQTVLEWASSFHRPGVAKIYVATRLLRTWSHFGADVTAAILHFIDSATYESGRNRNALYHLVSELARSEHFSTPRYLQWLIARGGLHDEADVVPSAPCSTRLLAELPTHNLSEGILELRMTLLTRANFSVDEEEEQVREYMAIINVDLPGMQTHVDQDLDSIDIPPFAHRIPLISTASRTSKSELGLWLRQKVRIQMIQPTIPPLDDWDDCPMKRGTSAITASEFGTIRQYLELINDYSMLADVMMIVASSNDPEVLASCADTLDLHLETFAAIGALKGLFDNLISRLRTLSKETDSIPRGFLVSVAELAARLPEQELTAQHLAQDLLRSDRKTAADACSPVSDHMAIVETAEVDFTDEIEKVLASGNSMDQGTLDRLFHRIILRSEESWEKSPEQQRSCGLLLTRLRTFDSKHFDVLMAAWVTRLLQTKARPALTKVLSPLISFGCLILRDVVLSYNLLVDTPDNQGAALEMLALLMEPCLMPDIITKQEAYRLRLKQSHMLKDYPRETLLIIRKAFESCPSDDNSPQHLHATELQSLLDSSPMCEVLGTLVLADPDVFVQELVLPLLQCGMTKPTASINAVIDYMLVGRDGPNQVTTEVLLNSANDLSLPFCQIKLASVLREEDTVMQDGDAGRSERLDAFDKAIKSAVDNGNTAWASIVPLLDRSVAQHLQQRAEQQFLALFPSPKTLNVEHLPDIQDRVVQARNVLRIINTTACIGSTISSSAIPEYPSLGPDIVAACNGLWLVLSNSYPQELKDCIITHWLPMLLSFIILHESAFDTTKSGHESRAKTILSLVAIYLQLQVLDVDIEVANELMKQTFDLSLSLVDLLPEDMRQQCIRSLRDTVCSPSVSYMLSYCANPSEWLVMVQKERVPARSGASADSRPVEKEKLTPFSLRRWENLGEPTPNVGENDTSLSLTLFGARRG